MADINLKHIARLSRLHLTPEELRFFEGQVGQILDFVEKLKEVRTEGIQPTSHPLTISNVFRPDVPVVSTAAQDVLKHAPKARGRFFEVPKIIEDKS